MKTGTCLCGQIAFTINGDLSPPSVCHCRQCRRQSGHVWASAATHRDNLVIVDRTSLAWYRASDMARRGFCRECGSFLFWQHNDEDTISVSMGALDPPTGLTLSRHIFVAGKGDYYDITDNLPQSV